MTSYDQGDFDERLNARGLSAWYTQAPAAISAQVPLCRQSEEDPYACIMFLQATVLCITRQAVPASQQM